MDDLTGVIHPRMTLHGVMRIAGHDVRQTLVEESETGRFRRGTEPTGNRKRSKLHQTAILYPRLD
jgi:hypothetical protein